MVVRGIAGTGVWNRQMEARNYGIGNIEKSSLT